MIIYIYIYIYATYIYACTREYRKIVVVTDWLSAMLVIRVDDWGSNSLKNRAEFNIVEMTMFLKFQMKFLKVPSFKIS